jgi:hypothetical protein
VISPADGQWRFFPHLLVLLFVVLFSAFFGVVVAWTFGRGVVARAAGTAAGTAAVTDAAGVAVA